MSDLLPYRPGKKGRSPSYPSLPLNVAIERARHLWEVEGRNSAPIAAIHEHWGYSPSSGPANLALASLIKYGLLQDEGSGSQRTAALTALAREILVNPDPAPYIREAALYPPIHREIWEQYEGDLPSDRTLRYELVQRRNFTESGAADFIRQFRRTVEFAQLEAPARPTAIVDEDASEDPREGRNPTREGTTTVIGAPEQNSAIHLPLIGGNSVTFSGTFPIPAEAWTQMLTILEALRPGLVVAEES